MRAGELRRLGYRCWAGLLDTADYGVPRKRWRAYLPDLSRFAPVAQLEATPLEAAEAPEPHDTPSEPSYLCAPPGDHERCTGDPDGRLCLCGCHRDDWGLG